MKTTIKHNKITSNFFIIDLHSYFIKLYGLSDFELFQIYENESSNELSEEDQELFEETFSDDESIDEHIESSALFNVVYNNDTIDKVLDCLMDKGLKVDKYFCDNGVSGRKYDRHGLSEMFKVIQNGDIVVVKDIARLSRNMDQCMYFVEQIQKAGATLITVDNPDLKFDVY